MTETKAEPLLARVDVKFTFFKRTGKWYSEETVHNMEVELFIRDGFAMSYWYHLYQTCRAMFEKGKRPGLVNGYEFICIVEPLHPDGIPAMFDLDEVLRLKQERDRTERAAAAEG